MPKGTNQKFKLYRLAQIMQENTDDSHYMTMPEIMVELKKYGITAERKSIYSDLKDLEQMGIEVQGEKTGKYYQYHVVNRPFELAELKLLVDAIQSSKFITERKSKPSVEEITRAIKIMLTKIDKDKLWVNPDCGLKTRSVPETEASLKNMVKAAEIIRAEL